MSFAQALKMVLFWLAVTVAMIAVVIGAAYVLSLSGLGVWFPGAVFLVIIVLSLAYLLSRDSVGGV